jgi:hypothetical protein
MTDFFGFAGVVSNGRKVLGLECRVLELEGRCVTKLPRRSNGDGLSG